MSQNFHKKMTYSQFYNFMKLLILSIAFSSILYILAGYCKGESLTHHVGSFVGTLLLLSFIALFFENTRQKSFDILKVSLSVLFILFSTIHYFESENNKLEVNRQKDLIEFSLDNESNAKLKNSIVPYENAWKKSKKMNDEYLILMQEMIICFSIGIGTYMLLEIIPIMRISYLHQKMIKELENSKK